MKSFLISLLLLTTPGCALWYGAFGFDTTEGAVHCGQQNGIQVWVDNKTTDKNLSLSCPEALKTVAEAHDVGCANGLWSCRQKWDYMVQFVNSRTCEAVKSLDSEHAAGYTLTFWSHVSCIAYGSDAPESFVTNEPSSAVVILMHEMIHMTEGGNGAHCHWTTKYAEAFKHLKNGGAQSWDDLCEHITCSGAICGPDSFLEGLATGSQ